MTNTRLVRHLSKTVVPVIIMVIVLGFFCGGMLHRDAMMADGMNMANMLTIKTEVGCCGGTMSQHIKSWLQTFLALPQEARAILKLVISSLIVGLAWLGYLSRNNDPNRLVMLHKIRFWRRISLYFFDPLEFALAKGILHPKLHQI